MSIISLIIGFVAGGAVGALWHNIIRKRWQAEIAKLRDKVTGGKAEGEK